MKNIEKDLETGLEEIRDNLTVNLNSVQNLFNGNSQDLLNRLEALEKALKDLQQKEQEDLDITVQELDDKIQMMKESMEVNINLIQKSSEEDNERKLADIDDK